MNRDIEPAVQFAQEVQAAPCLTELHRQQIEAVLHPIDRVEPLPEWADSAAGGFILLVQRDRFQQAMEIIGGLLQNGE